ncbi:serine/threonine protein kinase [Enemella dayhoffiae]|uniref:Serine/threonine protein kinase n=1 Tax=Enemella dayhoffiae TaxID=2016507 RepID=A0A255HFX3_9ACTN|nr:serine/threonine-protein kinase [Enemella dayhoffiae]OYO25384.1 serine/threonine protein kinase [Enemella dayhoffiae]
MGEVFGGRFELVDPIGAGGAGSVWRVWDWKRSQYCAAKVMKQSDSTALLRFIRETGTRIDHPHVGAPTSWVGEDDRVLFTMDLVTGGSVATMINDYGRLPDWFSMIITDQLLEALASVHASGLIHRDVKPANLLLEATGTGLPRVRLADFGIAARGDDPRLTHTTEVVGTPGYMSPLARMGVDPEPAQDLYAAAMVLAEMLTGRRPTETEPPFDLSDVDCAPELVTLTERMAADSGHGFDSAEAARASLRGVVARHGAGDEPVEVFDQVGPLPPDWGPHGPLSRDGQTPAGGWAPGTPITGPQPVLAGSPVSQPYAPTGAHPWTPAGSAPGPVQQGTPGRTAAGAGLAARRRTPRSVWVLGIAGLICLLVALGLAIF